MKSLEILEHIKNAPEFMGGDERYKSSINSPIRYIEDIMAIKQYLEVLEIIWKKRISMEYLWFLYDYYKDFTNGINYMLEKINEHQDETRKLTVEELLKIKQWLEENDE